jgi:hypothetical protein
MGTNKWSYPNGSAGRIDLSLPAVDEVGALLASGDHERLSVVLETVDFEGQPVGLLNELLLNDGHQQHQRVAFALQKIGDSSTAPFVDRSLELGFERLEYTCAEDSVIAKWHSWVLAGIGTVAAIEVLRRHSNSSNPAIAEAMAYRLAALGW